MSTCITSYPDKIPKRCQKKSTSWITKVKKKDGAPQ